VKLPDGVEMVMPGDNVTMEIELLTPMRWRRNSGLRFAKVAHVGAGVIGEVIQ